MKNVKRWTFITAALLVLVVASVDAVAPFKKVSIATTSKTTSTTAAAASSSSSSAANSEDIAETGEGETAAEAKEDKSDNGSNNSTSTKDSRLTGIPQIDYIWDPNLPRELRGYNLSSYPFLSTTPIDEEIHFKCDGLHDGFYASIEYKCQVYHHCVYGIRHDFLCANFTAFDQKTFICHFVSDVDCEGSQKYWNRNDDLYMATTTTSTTTTTTEPPPTQRRRPVRPLRPLRRPSNRRPIDDYYYEDEEYDEDYYEERINRRRKQRPRQRKPVAEYEEEYEDEKRSFADEKPRRANGRDRIRDEVEPEDDYDTDRRNFEKPKLRTKPTAAAERRKISSRKPSQAFAGRANADERRSFTDDRPLTGRKKAAVEEPPEPIEPPRRSNGRRRVNDKRSTTASPSIDLDDLDEYEKPHSSVPDQEEAAADEEVPPKIKTTQKPIEEFITPKAAPSSVYARPRAPPRIARPVPVNAKGKFQYPIQRTATTSAPPAAAHNEDEDYYVDEEYDDTRSHRGHNKKRIVDEVIDEDEDIPAAKRGFAARKPTRTLRKPTIEKKPQPAIEEEDYEADDRYTRRGSSRRRNPLTGRTRNRAPLHDDVDFVDDDYDERPLKRPRTSLRKGAKKPLRLPEPSEEVETEELEVELKPLPRVRGGLTSNRRKPIPSIPSRSRSPSAQAVSLVNSDEEDPDIAEDLDDASAVSNKNGSPTSRPASVRVVKRPFLPSRGGSPYLPRGLQPVGIAHKSHDSHTTDSSMLDMFSTNSGVHLLEHGAPLLRDSGPRTTLPPRSAIPVSQPRPEPQPSSKATLDELYENDYDVTLNDALNPTLKPLSPHQSNLYHQNQHHEYNNSNRPYQSIYSSPISSASFSSSSPTSSLQSSESFVYKNQSPSSATSSSSPSFQSQSQPNQLTQSQNYHQTPHQQEPPSQRQYQQNSQNHNNNYNSDSYFSSTDIRRRTITSPPAPQPARSDYHRTSTNVDSRIAPNYYDDYEY